MHKTIPFFKLAYSKIRQSGALQRINRKWMKNAKSLNCDSNNSMEPITLNKIGLLIALVIMGVLFAVVALIIELYYIRIRGVTKSETENRKIDHIQFIFFQAYSSTKLRVNQTMKIQQIVPISL